MLWQGLGEDYALAGLGEGYALAGPRRGLCFGRV